MRRLSGLLVVALMVTTLATVASAATANYEDQVSSPGYSGSNGSLNWAPTPWYEFDDDGSASSGRARAVTSGNCPGGNYCLGLFGPGVFSTVSLARPANLGAFQSANLSYRVNFVVDEILSTGHLLVEGWDGLTWQSLTKPQPFLLGDIEKSFAIPASYVNAGFQVRFKVAGQLTGDVYIDDVEISGQVAGTTTTSTSTTSSTTLPTIPTTTLPTIPTTTLPNISTTTTLPGLSTTSTSSTTSTTQPTTTTSEGGDGTGSSTSSTSSTVSGGPATTTTTTDPGRVAASGGGDGSLPEKPVSGIRQASLGIQAGFDGGRFGEIEAAGVSVMGVDIEPNYTMAVEVIESSWVYLIGLALFIAAAIVGGLDRRRLKRAKHTSI